MARNLEEHPILRQVEGAEEMLEALGTDDFNKSLCRLTPFLADREGDGPIFARYLGMVPMETKNFSIANYERGVTIASDEHRVPVLELIHGGDNGTSIGVIALH